MPIGIKSFSSMWHLDAGVAVGQVRRRWDAPQPLAVERDARGGHVGEVVKGVGEHSKGPRVYGHDELKDHICNGGGGPERTTIKDRNSKKPPGRFALSLWRALTGKIYGCDAKKTAFSGFQVIKDSSPKSSRPKKAWCGRVILEEAVRLKGRHIHRAARAVGVSNG